MMLTFVEAGVVVPDSGGIRKVRWRRAGSGKSGGVRVIYVTRVTEGEIVLLMKEIRRALET